MRTTESPLYTGIEAKLESWMRRDIYTVWRYLYIILIKEGKNSSTWSSLEDIILTICSKWTSLAIEEIKTLWDLVMQLEGCRLPGVISLPQVWSYITTDKSKLKDIWGKVKPAKQSPENHLHRGLVKNGYTLIQRLDSMQSPLKHYQSYCKPWLKPMSWLGM